MNYVEHRVDTFYDICNFNVIGVKKSKFITILVPLYLFIKLSVNFVDSCVHNLIVDPLLKFLLHKFSEFPSEKSDSQNLRKISLFFEHL